MPVIAILTHLHAVFVQDKTMRQTKISYTVSDIYGRERMKAV